jgi:prephenate dehydrogenase
LARALAATGWRDMTRLAGSAWSVWRDICLTNQPNISNALGFKGSHGSSSYQALLMTLMTLGRVGCGK